MKGGSILPLVLPLKVSQILILGLSDSIVAVASIKDFTSTAPRNGDEVRLLVLEKAGHFDGCTNDLCLVPFPGGGLIVLVLKQADAESNNGR